MDDELGICHAHGRLRCGECRELEGLREDVNRLRAQLVIAREALENIVAHEWAIGKPLWSDEFVDVAREALDAMDKEG